MLWWGLGVDLPISDCPGGVGVGGGGIGDIPLLPLPGVAGIEGTLGARCLCDFEDGVSL